MGAIAPLLKWKWPRGYWTGARDIGNNDTYIWVQTDKVLPVNSNLWRNVFPINVHDYACVYYFDDGTDAGLANDDCQRIIGIICEDI